MSDSNKIPKPTMAELVSKPRTSSSNNISQAPPPVTLPRGRSYIPPEPRDERLPRWDKWRLMPEVEIWEAVSLSLNIEPEKIKTKAWMGAAHQYDEGDEFNDRLAVLQANVSNRAFFPTACRNIGNPPYQHTVRLDKFSSWAFSDAKWEIPAELKSIASKGAPTSMPVADAVEAGTTDDTPAAKATVSPLDVFHAMKNLTADELTLTFVGGKDNSHIGVNNMLEISARNVTKRIPLAQLDLVNRIKSILNKQGYLLLGMTQNRAALTRNDANATSIKLLRKIFKNHFGIKSDPFKPFYKGVGWEPCFTITDKRGAADKRAMREAEHRTESINKREERGIQHADATGSHPFYNEENDRGEGDDETDDYLKKHG